MKSEEKRRKSGPNGSPDPVLFLPPGAVTCAEVFLILPGLNLNPAKLRPLREFLLGGGHAVLCPPLKGLGNDVPAGAARQSLLGEEWAGVIAEDWLEDLDRALEQLRLRFPKAAISLLGYSMGAVLGLVWSLSRQQPLKRAILLAPALGLKRVVALPLRLLCALFPRRLLLPSLGPSPYLVHRGTSLAAYGALLNLIDTFQRADGPGWHAGPENPTPPLFLAWHGKDELISTAWLARYAGAGENHITTHTLAHAAPAGATRHLGIDAHTLGDSEWAALLSALKTWLAA